ncbi:MAG: cation transporter [Acidimicrobiaceae bacterium]|nr:cation transporter [Acidimicrobiaceae bacterium]
MSVELPSDAVDPSSRQLMRQGYWLEVASMIWTTIDAAAAMIVGTIASSIALVGMGIDTALDLLIGVTVIRYLRSDQPHGLRLIGGLCLVGAGYVFAESILGLTGHVRPHRSVTGLAIAACTLLVMPFLARVKRRTGLALGSRPLLVDATETLLCGVAAAAVLLGVVLDDWFGWSWTIPAFGLAVGAVACWQATHAWRLRH